MRKHYYKKLHRTIISKSEETENLNWLPTRCYVLTKRLLWLRTRSATAATKEVTYCSEISFSNIINVSDYVRKQDSLKQSRGGIPCHPSSKPGFSRCLRWHCVLAHPGTDGCLTGVPNRKLFARVMHPGHRFPLAPKTLPGTLSDFLKARYSDATCRIRFWIHIRCRIQITLLIRRAGLRGEKKNTSNFFQSCLRITVCNTSKRL